MQTSITDLLRQLRTTVKGGGDVTVGQMLKLLGVRGFAFLFFVLALLNVAIFMVPGLSILFGLPMVILAVQMVLGLRTPMVPSWLRHRTIKRALLVRGIDIGIRGMTKVEKRIRPRFLLIAGPHMDRFHSVLVLLLAVMMAFPIPFLNLPPSFGIIALAIGMMQRDGIFIVASYALTSWSLWLFDSIGGAAHRLAGL